MTTTRPFDAAVPAQPASDNAPASFRKSLRFMIASFLLRREVPGKQVDLRVGIALGDLVHYGGRALAFLEGLHLRNQELLRLPGERGDLPGRAAPIGADRKSTRLNSSHANISYAVFCLKKKKTRTRSYEPPTPKNASVLFHTAGPVR